MKMMHRLLHICLSFLVLFSFMPTNAQSYGLGDLSNISGVVGVKVEGGLPSLLFAEGENSEEMERLFFQLYGLDDPERELWVNLKPGVGSKGLIGRWVGCMDVGRYLFETDLRLKEDATRMVDEVLEDYGIDVGEVGLEMRFWIEGGDVRMNEYEDGMLIDEARLKVRAEVKGSTKEGVEELNRLINGLVIPKLKEEVNEGKRYKRLRELYRLYIVSRWLKEKEVGNGLVERVAYYYGRVGSKEWMLLDVLRRYLMMYEGVDGDIGGCVVGGVYLGKVGRIMKRVAEGGMGGIRKIGRVGRRILFNKKFVVFMASLMFAVQTVGGSISLARGLDFGEMRIGQYVSENRELKEQIHEILKDVKITSSKDVLTSLYSRWKDQFSVIIQGKGDKVDSIIIKDIRKAIILSFHPIYGDLFGNLLVKAQRCKIQQQITMGDINWIMDFYRNYSKYRNTRRYQNSMRLLGSLFQNDSFLKLFNQIKGKELWGPNKWRIEALNSWLYPETAKSWSLTEDSSLLKFTKDKEEIKKNLDKYKNLAKRLFYYWVYAKSGDRSLIDSYIKKVTEEIKLEMREIGEKDMAEYSVKFYVYESKIRGKEMKKIFPGLFELANSGDPYATALWINVELELRYWAGGRSGFRFSNLKTILSDVYINLGKLTDEEKRDFVKFMWWLYFRSGKSFVPPNVRKKVFSELIHHLDLGEYLDTISGMTDFMKGFNKLIDDEDSMFSLRWELMLKHYEILRIVKTTNEWEKNSFGHIEKNPIFVLPIPIIDNLDSRWIRFFILAQRFGFEERLLRLIDLDKIIKVNLAIPLRLSDNFWSAKKDEVEDFLSFFLFRKGVYDPRFEYGTFNFSQLFFLYFSDIFQKGFKDIKDRQLKFVLLCGVMSWLIDNGKYDVQKGGFDFNEDQIRSAIKHVRKSWELMKDRKITFAKGLYNLVEICDSNFPNTGKDGYEKLLSPNTSIRYRDKDKFLKGIKDIKGPLWLGIMIHGGADVAKYKEGDRDNAFYLVSPDKKGRITVDEMVDALEGYAKNNNGDLSKMVIVAGNCYSGFWINVLKKLGKNVEIKGAPIVLSGALPTSPQLGFTNVFFSIFGSNNIGTFWDVAIQEFLEDQHKDGKTTATIYDLLNYLADKKLPFFPMIYSVEKEGKGQKKGVRFLLLSLGTPFGVFPWMPTEEKEPEELFREFLDNIEDWVEETGYQSLFVNWLRENKDRLLSLVKDNRTREMGRVSVEGIKDWVEKIERGENLLEEDAEMAIVKIAGMIRDNPEGFVKAVTEKIEEIFAQSNELAKEKGGIEFSDRVLLGD